jgi:hypothetical protein
MRHQKQKASYARHLGSIKSSMAVNIEQARSDGEPLSTINARINVPVLKRIWRTI